MTNVRPTFTVKVNERGHGTVLIGGHDISTAVESFRVESEVGEPSYVHLKLIGVRLDIDIEAVRLGYKLRNEIPKTAS